MIAKDVVVVWTAVRQRIMAMFEVSIYFELNDSQNHSPISQDYDCKINILTDAWTSPNHLAFVAFVAQIEREGKLVPFLLNILEVPESHTGETLAKEMRDVLEDFSISERVSSINIQWR